MTGHGHFVCRPAVLFDHIRLRLRDLDYPGVVPRQDSQVEGMLVHGISEQQMLRLDMFEGEEYQRMEVEVQEIGSQAWSICHVYIFTDQSQLLTTLWSFEQFQLESSHKWTNQEDDTEYEMLHDTAGIGRRRRIPR